MVSLDSPVQRRLWKSKDFFEFLQGVIGILTNIQRNYNSFVYKTFVPVFVNIVKHVKIFNSSVNGFISRDRGGLLKSSIRVFWL